MANSKINKQYININIKKLIMQTYTITNQQLDIKKLINEQKNEPIILKNKSGSSFLLMPFSEDKKLDVFLNLYKSFKDLSKLAYKNSQNLELIEDKGMLMALHEIKKEDTAEADEEELNAIFNGDFITQ